MRGILTIKFADVPKLFADIQNIDIASQLNHYWRLIFTNIEKI